MQMMLGPFPMQMILGPFPMQMIMGPFTYTMQMTHANSPGDKIVCLYNGTLAIIQVDL